MKDSNSVPVGLPIGQNEPSVPIGSHIQPSEPIEDKKRITSVALIRADCAGLGKDVVGREARSMGEKSCAWILGMQGKGG
jgi:hypothetical protein